MAWGPIQLKLEATYTLKLEATCALKLEATYGLKPEAVCTQPDATSHDTIAP